MTEDSPSTAPAANRDWLLTSARLLVTVIMALTIVVGVALTAAAVAAPIMQNELLLEINEHVNQPVGTGVIAVIVGFMLATVAFMVIGFLWLRELRRIIDSVGLGDPFNPANAERLARMGWLTVIVEALSIPGGALAAYLTHLFDRAHLEIGLSLGGVLMALVLFILARVFREGARMRDELEGTV